MFTQADIDPRWRGVVWDCRSGVPVPADFDAPVKSDWDRPLLGHLLAHYPDKELLSFVTRGAASKSEATGLVMVLGPHLQSLAGSFAEVASAIDTAVARGRYGRVLRALAFVPCHSIPQGAVGKSDGSKRRTSDFGHSRKPTEPLSIPINVAARSAGWVPEAKPTNAEFADDIATLRYAADLLDDDLFLFSDDFESWFNQFATHPSEWFKTCFQWIAADAGVPTSAWVVEFVLGFGMSPSSNIAQRFAHALLWLLFQQFDAEEAAAHDIAVDPVLAEYLRDRAALGPDQAALYTAACYTDDTRFAVVGANRAARLMQRWGELKEKIGVASKQEKRQAGNCVLWTGAFSNSFTATQVIPNEKVLRALVPLRRIIAGLPVPFSEYRSLMGLVVHFQQLLRLRRRELYHMWTPHKRGRRHPAEPIKVTPLLLAKAEEWTARLLHIAGASCAGPARTSFAAQPFSLGDTMRSFFAFTDAALQGAPVPGLGGWFHGYFFSVPLPTDMLGVPIVQLEFLAIILGHMLFLPLVGDGHAVLMTDSETSAKIAANDGARTPMTQWLHEQLISLLPARSFDAITHLYGEMNPFADLASRGRLPELVALAQQLGIRTTRLEPPSAFDALLAAFRARFGPMPAKPGALQSRPRAKRATSLAVPSRPVPALPASAPAPSPPRPAAALLDERSFGGGRSSDELDDRVGPAPTPPRPAKALLDERSFGGGRSSDELDDRVGPLPGPGKPPPRVPPRPPLPTPPDQPQAVPVRRPRPPQGRVPPAPTDVVQRPPSLNAPRATSALRPQPARLGPRIRCVRDQAAPTSRAQAVFVRCSRCSPPPAMPRRRPCLARRSQPRSQGQAKPSPRATALPAHAPPPYPGGSRTPASPHRRTSRPGPRRPVAVRLRLLPRPPRTHFQLHRRLGRRRHPGGLQTQI